MKKGPLSLLAGTLLLAGCGISPTQEEAAGKNVEGLPTYFSMKAFILDQISLLKGQPYTLQKIVKLNGKTDTSIVALQTEDWSPVYAAFQDAEIGLPKFTGRYNFTQFHEDITRTEQFVYEAKEEKLPVRRLMIAINDETAKVTSVLAETEKKNFWGGEKKRLFYSPLKTILIQEDATAKVGADKTFSVEYRFLRDQDAED